MNNFGVCGQLIIGIVVIATARVALPATLPDAATVAVRINQRVTFEDTIKAASKSQTHDGFYLSFGAPYPKQVLSVWVPESIGKKLPGGLIGRSVRIEGLVQSSPTGPIINLDSPEHFQLSPIDESILSKVKIGGKTDRRQFMLAIKQHIKQQDIDTIEVLGNELHQSHERFTDGLWIVDAYFDAFSLSPRGSNKNYEDRMQLIANWKLRYPTSILVSLIDARYHLDLAWKWRGTQLASKVTREGWQHFDLELAEARRILESNPGIKASPDYFVEMQMVALGQNWKKEDYFRLFDEAVSREPEYYRYYFAAAYYLLPKWHGAKGDWEKFSEQQREKLGGPMGDALYARIAWSVSDEYPHHLFDQTAISWEIMAEGFVALMQQYPESAFNKSAYACFAWEAGDRDRLRPALEAIKSNPDMEIWVNLENIQLAEKFARAESTNVPAK